MSVLPKSLTLVACILLGCGSLVASATAANSSRGRTAHPAVNVAVVDSRHLVVGAGCPSDTPVAHVTETRAAVRIRVVSTATSNLCLRSVPVTLKSPLGKRRIIDATTGRRIPKLDQAAAWFIDRNSAVSAASTEFTADVVRLSCSGGVIGTVQQPSIHEDAAQVVVTFMVEAMPPGNYACPGNGRVPTVVQLHDPIGQRQLVDGACLPGGAAVSTSDCVAAPAGPIRWQPSSARTAARRRDVLSRR
jgi:hypothetical protein